jgi:hypothetical protein
VHVVLCCPIPEMVAGEIPSSSVNRFRSYNLKVGSFGKEKQMGALLIKQEMSTA